VTSPGLPLPDLAGTLNTALREKHLLLFVSDASAAGLLRRQNWDGALGTSDGSSDRLLVVDSNVGFNKADASVMRFVDYRVDLTVAGQPRAELVLTYRHGAADRGELCVQEARYGDTYLDMTERCYWDYVRIHVPAGSRLLASPSLALPRGSLSVRQAGLAPQTPLHPESPNTDWLAWAEFFDLAPGTERVLIFSYILSPGMLEMDSGGRMHYRLLVQKQPGTEAVPLRLEIRLPPDVEVVRTAPRDLTPELAIITDLRTDRQFEVVFLRK
jgi:hypothetical protein